MQKQADTRSPIEIIRTCRTRDELAAESGVRSYSAMAARPHSAPLASDRMITEDRVNQRERCIRKLLSAANCYSSGPMVTVRAPRAGANEIIEPGPPAWRTLAASIPRGGEVKVGHPPDLTSGRNGLTFQHVLDSAVVFDTIAVRV